MVDPGEATALIRLAADGEQGAEARLLAVLYDELHRIARAHMRGLAQGHTLQPTALVHEAWLRLDQAGAASFDDREHFLSYASRAMRSVLVDHARRRSAVRRGGDMGVREPLDAALDQAVDDYERRGLDLLALHEALERLATQAADLARLVDLRFFAGLGMSEVAALTGVSQSTAERSWRLARMWLRDALGDDSPS
jgi:RNA polymerase sigma factor (TIGR02999 family)